MNTNELLVYRGVLDGLIGHVGKLTGKCPMTDVIRSHVFVKDILCFSDSVSMLSIFFQPKSNHLFLSFTSSIFFLYK